MLIYKAFSCLKPEHLSVRQSAFNYLCGLIGHEGSRNVITGDLLLVCVENQLRFFEKAQFFDIKTFSHVFY